MNEIILIQSLTRIWYIIKVQLRLAMVIFGFISIGLTHALTSRGSDKASRSHAAETR